MLEEDEFSLIQLDFFKSLLLVRNVELVWHFSNMLLLFASDKVLRMKSYWQWIWDTFEYLCRATWIWLVFHVKKSLLKKFYWVSKRNRGKIFRQKKEVCFISSLTGKFYTKLKKTIFTHFVERHCQFCHLYKSIKTKPFATKLWSFCHLIE